MDNTDLKIGLAFSGGGFRASSFSLGVLSYLNEVNLDDTKLITKIYALSTISGGTITGARYAQGIKNQESFDQIYWSLYDFMADTNLIDISLGNLASKKDKNDKRNHGMITAFADAYDEYLFKKGKFGTLLSDENPIHLKHISFNATEFTNALQFRFQKTETIENVNPGEPDKGIIGNYYYRIPEDIASDIRLGDILAASSCFPGGFEPINFPDDFVLNQTQNLDQYIKNNKFPTGLMDGGIVDNQGIEPLLLTEKRMKRDRSTEVDEDSEINVFDLLIISDVTSPYMDSYQPNSNKKSNFFRRLNFKKLLNISHLVLLLSLAGILYSVYIDSYLLSTVFTVLVTLSLLVYLLLTCIKKLPRIFQVPNIFMKSLGKLLKVRFYIYENMILNRSNSLLKMANDVFLKHIRRLNYNKIYQDKSWRNRRIMNAIYELRTEEERLQKKIKEGKLNPKLIPSEAIQKVASVASSMATTLWFTKKELKDENMLNSIIACGQITMCWNLLEYFDKIKKNPENTNENHTKFLQIEDQLLKHWEKFKEEPFWLVDSVKR